MDVISKDEYYLGLAFAAARRSKCVRAQYGSVLVSKDDRIIATGYNGKPRGSSNDGICYREGLPPNARDMPNCCLHSEVNCILFSDPHERIGGTLYVTGSPCKDCALLIMQSGITRLVFFAGVTLHGHRGNASDQYFEQYGSRIETRAFHLSPGDADIRSVFTTRIETIP